MRLGWGGLVRDQIGNGQAACLHQGFDSQQIGPLPFGRQAHAHLPHEGGREGELQRRGILLDGSTENNDPRLLLQIFSQTMIGPVFFEFIQRKKDEGFGEGNFTALFKSIEADQIRRGALQVEDAS